MSNALHLAARAGVLSMTALVLAGAAPASAAVPAGGISGSVYSSVTAKALAGATVIAYALPGQRPGCVEAGPYWKEVASTRTSATGAYRLALAPGFYRIGVVPRNLALDSFGFRVSAGAATPNVTSWVGWADDVIAPSTGIDVKMAAPKTIQGTVTDTADLPLARITVRAFAGGGDGSNSYYQPSGYVPSATSDRFGHYTIAGLPTGLSALAETYMITMTDPTGRHEDWISPPGPTASPGDTFPAQQMRATRPLVGTVRDESGRSLAGITVWPIGKAYALPMLTTDAQGRFVTSWFYQPAEGANPEIDVYLQFIDPKGVYRTTYYSSERSRGEADAVTAPAGAGDVTITQVLQRGGSTITGTAVYSGPNPAPGTMVTVMVGTDTPSDDEASNETFGVAGCDGTFTVTGVWPGDHTVFVGPVPVNVTTYAGATSNLGTITVP